MLGHVKDTPTKRRGPMRIMTQNELILTLINLRLGFLHSNLPICSRSVKSRLFQLSSPGSD